MYLNMLKSKIHRATVTDADLDYVGSITVDEELMEKARLLQHEQVHVVNINNGERFTTYVIPGERGSGTICLNGAAARLAEKGDLVIIMAYAAMETVDAVRCQPLVVHVDENNKIIG